MRTPGERMRTPLSRLPIRLRLAVSVGGVTFLMLVVFGMAVRTLTAHRLRANFDSQVTTEANNLAGSVHVSISSGRVEAPNLTPLASLDGGAARIFTLDGSFQDASENAPYLGAPPSSASFGGGSVMSTVNGYRVITSRYTVPELGAGSALIIQYGLPIGSLNADIANLDFLVFFGVLAGTALALESMTQAVRHLAFVIPAGIGVQEAGLVLFGHALGIGSELALAVSMAKRMREVLCGLPSLVSWQWLEGQRLQRPMRNASS